MKIEPIKTSRKKEHELHQLSPFELKDNLIRLAEESRRRPQHAMLNAGRGNPNWTAPIPREAFLALGQFGVAECRRVIDRPSGVAGIPQKEGIGSRFEKFLKGKGPGMDMLRGLYFYGIEKHGFKPDDWAMELADGIIGDQYPDPGRMLHHTETIVHDYFLQEMCGGQPSHKGRYDLFAVEGGTAAICYIFDSLINNGLLKRGDRIALGVPIFTPYLEIPELERYRFKVTYVYGTERDNGGSPTFQYPAEEIDKLGDGAIKAFFVINPSNPTSVQIGETSRKHLVEVVNKLNPNLMIITDDVYGTFADGFRSLADALPRNTLCVYSFSKYFGATGWRLGIIGLYEDNIYDDMLSALPESQQLKTEKRYRALSLHPRKMKFIDRMVADSRQVALNHTAGLSLPQQMQMLLFAGFALLDIGNAYKNDCRDIVRHRYQLLWEGIGVPVYFDRNRAAYYCQIDIRQWALKKYGKEFVVFLEKNFEPVDMLFRLAERSKIVLLNGDGFVGPEWSVRVSLANLDEQDYTVIGKAIASVVEEYIKAWKSK